MTTTTPKPLSETQMLVLTNAAQRPNLFVLPLPSTVNARGSVKRNLLFALLRMQMIQEALLITQPSPGGPTMTASTSCCI